MITRLPRPGLGRAATPRVPAPRRWRLASGLSVVAVPRRELPQVVVRLVIPAGAVADPPGREGLASMVSEVLLEGTERLDAVRLNERLDLLGASITTDASHDHVEIDGVFLSDTLAEALPLLAEIVRTPAFPPGELERLRDEALDSLIARQDEPANVADDRASERLFGCHPYARLVSGTPQGLAGLDVDDLRRFHALRYQPGGAALVLAGDFELDVLASLVEAAFGDWIGRAPPLEVSPPAVPEGGAPPFHVPWEGAPQAEIRIAALGIERSSPEWVSGIVANYLLGGSTITGRLGANLREDKGWTYGVRSGFSAGIQPAGWTVDTAVDGEVAAAAVEEMLGEIRRMAEEPVAPSELARAKEALILSLPRSFETPARIVTRFAALEAFGLEPEYWSRFPARAEEVTREEVRAFVERRLHPEKLLSVVVGGDPPGRRSR
jgi:zinc protease